MSTIENAAIINETTGPKHAAVEHHKKPGLTSQHGNSSPKSKVRKIRAVGSKAKRRAKRLLGAASDSSSSAADTDTDDDYKFALNTVKNDPAFNPSNAEDKSDPNQPKPDGPLQRAKATLDVAASTIAHPRRAAKSKVKRTAAGQLSSSAQDPSAARKADLRFLEAEERSVRSGESRSSSQDSSEDEADKQRLAERSKELEDQRDSLRAAWITSRVRRIRVVPKEHFKFPSKEDFRVRDDAGNVTSNQWHKWAGNVWSPWLQR